MWGTYVHMYTKYEDSMTMTPMMMPMTTHDGQSMIIQGSLVDKPNEPKTKSLI